LRKALKVFAGLPFDAVTARPPAHSGAAGRAGQMEFFPMTVINTNTAAMRATNASTSANKMLSTSMERLSTGKRINSAKDDAAGLAIANRMASQTKSMAMAVRNANDGISLAQTAEGALGEVTNMLTRMKELSTQSANGTLKDSDRSALQSEMSQLTQEISNVAKTTSFNGVNLLDGSANAVKLQTGINADQTISMALTDTRTSSLGLTAQVKGTTVTATAITAGTVSVNGQDIGAITAANKDASKIAAAVNATTANSGVVATAKNTVTATLDPTKLVAGKKLTVGTTEVTLTAAESDATSVAARINATLNGVTGNQITASADKDGKLVLSSKDGSNIALTNTDAMITTATTAENATVITGSATAAATAIGAVTLEDMSGSGITIAGAGAADAGLTAGKTAGTVSIATQAGASAAMAVIDGALDKISAARGTMGAAQNRLESTVNNLTTTATNLSDAKSRIEDADFSTETTALAKAQILNQASTAMLAQANQSQQGVMKLLG
jgi:flagellin